MYKKQFKNTAFWYTKYRPGYPKEFFDDILKAYDIKKDSQASTLLDLGCGTGELTLPLAPYFKKVVAVDPEEEMLYEAKKKTVSAPNIKWLQQDSSKLAAISDEHGPFNLTVMGASFHWMERNQVLEILYLNTTKRGGVIITGMSSIWNKTGEWQSLVKPLIQKYLGAERLAGKNRIYKEKKKRHEDYITESSFNRVEKLHHSYVQKWTLEAFYGYLYSTSFCSAELLGDRRQTFEEELGTLIMPFTSNGKIVEQIDVETLLIRR